jgi:hypothetical protein
MGAVPGRLLGDERTPLGQEVLDAGERLHGYARKLPDGF